MTEICAGIFIFIFSALVPSILESFVYLFIAYVVALICEFVVVFSYLKKRSLVPRISISVIACLLFGLIFWKPLHEKYIKEYGQRRDDLYSKGIEDTLESKRHVAALKHDRKNSHSISSKDFSFYINNVKFAYRDNGDPMPIQVDLSNSTGTNIVINVHNDAKTLDKALINFQIQDCGAETPTGDWTKLTTPENVAGLSFAISSQTKPPFLTRGFPTNFPIIKIDCKGLLDVHGRMDLYADEVANPTPYFFRLVDKKMVFAK
jgi:hypothetical protein